MARPITMAVTTRPAMKIHGGKGVPPHPLEHRDREVDERGADHGQATIPGTK